ncbi:MAG: hypothetical protein ABIO83_04900 [Ilumatobacteraceae bacterium]
MDAERLAWGRTVHTLRALTEVATWEHHKRTDEHRSHPWLALRPLLEAELGSNAS